MVEYLEKETKKRRNNLAENKKCGLGTFVAGAAVGVGLGLLFAPKSGAETRKELKEKMDELLQNIKEIKMDDVKENLQNKRIILVDDIYTTGNTVNECCRILQKAQPKSISVIVIAKD